jgi:transcriptional regulator with XRE-family HTH domain
VSTKSKLIQKLRKRKDYREAFVASQISTGIPFQIRALRKAQNWSQEKLAEATQMLQPRICAMEQAGYGDFTLNTLKKLAAAFDVGLVVRFASFGEMVNWADAFSPDTFTVPSSKEDPVLCQREGGTGLRAVQNESSGIATTIQNQTDANQVSALLGEATRGRYVTDYRSLPETNEPQYRGAALAATEARAYA